MVVAMRLIRDYNGCPICLGETGETAWDTTTSACFELSCGHSACRVCLRKWLEQSEENDQEASCFECRQTMLEVEIRSILKREFQRRPKEPETTIDSLTLDWMNAHDIKQCPWCGIWIEKVGGCDYIQCRCRNTFHFGYGGCCDDVGSCCTSIDDHIAALNQLIEELEAGWVEDRMIGFDDEFIWEGCKSKLIQRRRIVKKQKRSRVAQEEWCRRRVKDKPGRKFPKDKSRRRRSPRKESRWVVDRSDI